MISVPAAAALAWVAFLVVVLVGGIVAGACAASGRISEHEGMMTRREVLEKLAQTHRAMSMAQSTSQVWWNGYMTGLAISAGIKGRLPEQVRDAAHELALLMNEERGKA